MNTIEITVTILFLVGGIALTATIIIYPKDIIKGVFTGIPMAFLQSLWNRIWFLLIPFWGPVWLLDKYFKWDIFDAFKNHPTLTIDTRALKEKLNLAILRSSS